LDFVDARERNLLAAEIDLLGEGANAAAAGGHASNNTTIARMPPRLGSGRPAPT
jgi:hypothetical protein